ncbi:MAG: hypothetical protein KC486_25860 [Myxococcales bacterium]|nr:hypothetical protein [Myxococcales bacterium]
MSRSLSEFLGGFVLPLLGGGPLLVGKPLRPEEVAAMAEELVASTNADLELLRQRRAQAVVAEPVLDEAGPDELGLWAALHNILVFDHPERPKVWTRRITWRRLEAASRTLLTLGQPATFEEALARHVAVGPFLELIRRDVVILTLEGEERYLGQPVPRRRLRYGRRDEVTTWIEDEHNAEVLRLMPDVLWASPVTCLLRPTLAPEGWTPLIAAPYLKLRPFARAVVYAWAGSRAWIQAGGAVMGGLMMSLAPPPEPTPEPSEATGEVQRALPAGAPIMALPGSTFNAGPEEIGALVGALTHLHFVKVLELGARLGVATATRERAVRLFLGLPLLAPQLEGYLGAPMTPPERGLGFDAQVARRWTEYTDHLADVLPRDVVENLRETLVPRILKDPAQ